MDELRIQLLFDLHLAGHDVTCSVILELSSEFADGVI